MRGILSAAALGLYTVAGGAGAVLALLPAALHPPARRGAAPEGSPPLPAPTVAPPRAPIAG